MFIKDSSKVEKNSIYLNSFVTL